MRPRPRADQLRLFVHGREAPARVSVPGLPWFWFPPRQPIVPERRGPQPWLSVLKDRNRGREQIAEDEAKAKRLAFALLKKRARERLDLWTGEPLSAEDRESMRAESHELARRWGKT